MPTSDIEAIAAAQKAGVEILYGLTSRTLEGFHKVAELNLQTMKWTLAETQACTRKAFEAKNDGDLPVMEARILLPLAEKAQAYCRQGLEIAAETRADLATVVEAQYEQSKRVMQDYIDAVERVAPSGSGTAMAAWKSALTATTSFLDAMQRTAKQVGNITENNVNLAASLASSSALQPSSNAARADKG
ncbi:MULTISPECIES: TIGR01841 family phasin [Cupriavidus]|uniref:Phasin (PHA-granule associated protein) n=3 Tax=Cupriavidus TaxID=106589 RepID=A0A375HWK3_9BURK|nr:MULTISPECIES: TIGR01841 family phasin [Cupriavidus]MCO4866008.1 TIGR01841 family phasin [Cupriavidus sp. WGlv3]MCO4893660.1 TIGR01841 family phasin [Cupriavidus sp. WGtm5]ULX56202.1 Phasin (PHA-granule associated protein) [Cupriavidus taiwanensis]CAP64202.1 Phasin (PHA-granule associated protein) [Cupriavidus taiwanensis LMG 19424]SOZ50702.1 Phasin (PHA-granule associated protein) [Cupriavidus taiwanensis]